MPPTKPAPLAHWHQILESKSFDALDSLLADDATFQSPVVHTPQVGKAITMMYLKSAGMLLLSGGTFRYVNEWWNDSSAVLEFEVEVNGITVNGVDMIFWNADGKIERFKVMIRPLKAVNLVHEAMGKLLAMGKAPS
jgi:hypothetical protein